MCLCKENHWARFFGGEPAGYPMSEHAPGCDEYVLEEFTVLEYDGTKCVMETHEAKAMIEDEGDEANEYTISTVMLTRDQFERLGEFQGF